VGFFSPRFADRLKDSSADEPRLASCSAKSHLRISPSTPPCGQQARLSLGRGRCMRRCANARERCGRSGQGYKRRGWAGARHIPAPPPSTRTHHTHLGARHTACSLTRLPVRWCGVILRTMLACAAAGAGVRAAPPLLPVMMILELARHPPTSLPVADPPHPRRNPLTFGATAQQPGYQSGGSNGPRGRRNTGPPAPGYHQCFPGKPG